MHERNVEARIELVRNSATELNIRGFDLVSIDDSQIDEFRSKLREVRKKRKLNLEEVQVGAYISKRIPVSFSCRGKEQLSKTSSMGNIVSWRVIGIQSQVDEILRGRPGFVTSFG